MSWRTPLASRAIARRVDWSRDRVPLNQLSERNACFLNPLSRRFAISESDTITDFRLSWQGLYPDRKMVRRTQRQRYVLLHVVTIADFYGSCPLS